MREAISEQISFLLTEWDILPTEFPPKPGSCNNTKAVLEQYWCSNWRSTALVQYWNSIGIGLEQYLNNTGAVQEQYWNSTETVLEQYWNSTGTVLKQNAAVLDQYWTNTQTVLEQFSAREPLQNL